MYESGSAGYGMAGGGYGKMPGYASSGYGSKFAGYSANAGSAGSGYAMNGGNYSSATSYGSNSYSNNGHAPAHAAFIAETFLNPERSWTPIISNLGEVQSVVEQTFEMITGQAFPHDDIKIMICKPEDFRKIHEATAGTWSEGIMGFSFNRFGKGASEIYVKEDHLDSLLLTIGHEVGHVLSPSLMNKHDEEAKAHAFSIAWMETIRDNNISGLQPNINLNPAHNGLHDTAYEFVKLLQNTGASALDVFKTLSRGLTSIIASEIQI